MAKRQPTQSFGGNAGAPASISALSPFDVAPIKARGDQQADSYADNLDPGAGFGIPFMMARQAAAQGRFDPTNLHSMLDVAREKSGTYNSIPGVQFLPNSPMSTGGPQTVTPVGSRRARPLPDQGQDQPLPAAGSPYGNSRDPRSRLLPFSVSSME